ncbi:xanthine dehydrogenase accessory factor [Natronincola peptidivorans]|uniref:Xanthine dehydrogenase accessory factor n=1 Tax=Natronincola peptidivorans TaxID=426128 RepID=A0A1I0EQP9_9FIRM|nr:XdhC/CoxI family protein [Natronincola peptidivorans]SET46924.1 xanthine dehydrogenase accessory factor [Natronincola peptidivorans]
MEYKLLDVLREEVKENRKAALVTVTKAMGSTPRKTGSMMVVFQNGRTYGTIGGGKFEIAAIHAAVKSLEEGKSGSFHFQLNDEVGSLQMQCGGEADVFIKVFVPNHKLMLVGGGHIALSLYELGKKLGFFTVVFEDREEYANKARFPDVDEIQLGNIEEKLQNYPIDETCYIVIVTRGHQADESALKSVIHSNAAYIGMIGSKNKTAYILDNLRKEGIPQDTIDKLYAPIGLGLGGETPEEIALSILAEILLVKNNGRFIHMKDK